MGLFSFLNPLNSERVLRQLEHHLNRLKSDRCRGQVTLYGAVNFSPRARVFNLQNNSSKITIGNGTVIDGMLRIFETSGEISIGEYCYVGENSYVWSASSIEIGSRVLISHNVNIHDNNSHPIDEKMRHRDFKRLSGTAGLEPDSSIYLKPSPIVIHDDAWIGFNSVILKGVTIGQGAIIGAASVVTADVPPNVIVAGNPAKIIRSVKESDIADLNGEAKL